MTIRAQYTDVSAMKQLAARNFEDILQVINQLYNMK